MREMSYIVTMILIVWCALAGAHPVSFKGSIIWDSQWNDTWNEWSLAASLSSRIALGLKHFSEMNGGQWNDWAWLQVNALIGRQNGEDYQFNFYAGMGYWGDKVLPFIQIDGETRRWYLMGDYQLLPMGSLMGFMSRQRVGVAPFLSEFDEWAAWWIIENLSSQGQAEIRQILRFFYKNLLYELGAGEKGNWVFNFMIHF